MSSISSSPQDNAWKNAIQMDDMKNETECMHCGFVSLFGGSSHLAGGGSRSHLSECPKVSPQVKQEMTIWFVADENFRRFNSHENSVTFPEVGLNQRSYHRYSS